MEDMGKNNHSRTTTSDAKKHIGYAGTMTSGGNMDILRQADDDTDNNSEESSDPGAQIKGYFRMQGVR